MRQPGYTLIELLVVLAVLGVMASVALPMAEMTVQREKERELKRALWDIRDAIDAYRKSREQAAAVAGTAAAIGAAAYPPNLNALVQPWQDSRAVRQGGVVRFLRRLPRDPFADSSLPAEQTWGLRSYYSEADNPQPGDDVFDVYSRSAAMGLNGVPLRQW